MGERVGLKKLTGVMTALLLVATGESFGAAPAWFTAMKDNTWATVAGEKGQRLADVAPSPEPPGAEGQKAVLNDWTGACANQATGEYIFPAQGGHNGYYGNEIYALALRDAAPAWKRIWGPTPNAQISTKEYGSNAAYTAYADGSPRPAHGWHSCLCSSDGRIWITLVDACPSGSWTTETYSIDRNKLTAGWTYHGRLYETVPGGRPGSSFGWQSGPGAYDPVGNTIWRGADFATQDGITSIDCVAAVAAGPQAHSGPKVPGAKTYNVALTGGTTFADSWSVVTADLSPRCWMVGAVRPGKLYVMDLEKGLGKIVPISTAGAPTGWTPSIGGVYHRQSRSVIVGGFEYGAELRKLSISGTNPLTATYTWSQVANDPSNAVTPKGGMNGTQSKLQIIDDMGNGQAALCLVTSVSGPTYVYKLPGAARSKRPADLAAGQQA